MISHALSLSPLDMAIKTIFCHRRKLAGSSENLTIPAFGTAALSTERSSRLWCNSLISDLLSNVEWRLND
jgi:hypothetical protein